MSDTKRKYKKRVEETNGHPKQNKPKERIDKYTH